MTEPSRVNEFLDLYKRLEETLEIRYRNVRRHSSSVVIEFTDDPESAPVREQLSACREIRNLLSHTANIGGVPVVEPSAQVVEALQEVLEYVTRPPLAMEFATRGDRIMKAGLSQKVLRLMQIMEKKGYSHIPVLQGGVLIGVFSVGAVFRYVLQSGGKSLTEQTTLRELRSWIELKDHWENYLFLPKDATYDAVRRSFEKVQGRNQRVSVIFLTEHGRPEERLLGMLTPWDVLGDPEPHNGGTAENHR